MKRACLPLLLFAIGCSNETRVFSISVKNEMAAPISVCTTKEHSPAEVGWEAPEDLILPPSPPSNQTPPGGVIPPGRILKIDNLNGHFDKERGQAVLRVYAGTPNLSQMSAISPGSINRLDVPLNPGLNRMQIMQQSDGSMKAVAVP